MPQTKPFGADIASNTDITANNLIINTSLFGNTTINTYVTSALISVSNSTSSANLNAAGLLVGISKANTTAQAVGANVIMDATKFFVGNTTVSSNLVAGQLIFTGPAAGLGIGTVPSYPIDIGNSSGGITTAKFGNNLSLYAVQANPTLGFNAYYNAGWKYGAGSANSFGGSIDVGPTTGTMSFNVTSVVGNTGGSATMVAIMNANTTGLTPGTSNTYDLGTSSLRWRNIYTNDLHLSNGIGDYTVVEGEEDLFLYNNKSGKTFKFALIEVDPSTVPDKAKT